jgi:DNA-binding SARP family transcriptional activator
MVSLRVLGAFEAATADGPVDLGGPRQRSVLALLVVAQGRVVAADRIVDDLWHGEPPPRAMGALQAYISHLRRALEPERAARTPAQILVSAAPGYAVRLSDQAVDAWRFERLVRSGAGLVDSEPRRAKAELDEALGLWGGPAYAEFATEPWAEAEASRLHELQLVGGERRAEAALALGMAAESVPDLESLTTANPLREEAWRLLALALYRSGRQGDALGALRRARSTLSDELGVDPGPVLQRLEADILAQSPALDLPSPREQVPVAAPTAPAPAVPAAAPQGHMFVGRRGELATLLTAADAARAGRARLAFVAADPGGGKTALVRELETRLTAGGWRSAWGRSPEYDGAPAAWPWSEILRHLAVGMPPDDALATVLAPLLADAAHPVDPVGKERPGTGSGRFRLHRAIGSFLSRLAASGPVLVVLDDLHRADSESLAVLADVMALLRDSPVLIVGTYRGAEVGGPLADALAELAKHAPTRLQLGGLGADEVARLIREESDRDPDDATVAAIVARTDGNPFYVRESARLLASEGELVATTEVPAGVRDVLRRRVSRLPAPAQTVLRLAAVIGREVDVDLLIEAGDADEEQVLDAVDAGIVSGLLEEPETGRIRFAHVLVRDTLYDEVSRLRRARMHGRVAASLEHLRPGDRVALAHHHRESGTAAGAGKAVEYAAEAAREAMRRYAYGEAIRLLELAMADLDRVEGSTGSTARQRAELLIQQVRVFGHAGRLANARQVREAAITLSQLLEDPELTARAVTAYDVASLGETRRYGKVDHAMVAWVRQTLDLLPDGDSPLRCRLLGCVAVELAGEGDPEADRLSQEACEMARRLADPVLLAHALNCDFFLARSPGHLDRRRSIADELIRLGTTYELPGYEMLGHQIKSQVLIAHGHVAEALRHNELAARLSRTCNQPFAELQTEMMTAMCVMIRDGADAAEPAYVAPLERYAAFGPWDAAGLAWLIGFVLRHEQGRMAEEVESARAIYGVYGPIAADPFVLALIAAGRMDEAREVWQPEVKLRADYLWFHVTVFRAECAIALGDVAAMQATYDALLPFQVALAGASGGSSTLGPVATVLGDLAVGLDRRDDAERHYRDGLELARRVGSAAWEQKASQALAAVTVPRARDVGKKSARVS